MEWDSLITVGMIAFAVAYVGTGAARHALLQMQMLDVPNARSNHKLKTPRGGGFVVTATILLGLLLASLWQPLLPVLYVVCAATLALAAVSWLDDMKGVNIKWRLLTQFLCAGICSALLFHDKLLFQGLLPPILDKCLTVLLWVWFINLYNFMDGIDGITGSQTVLICTGILVITSARALPMEYGYYATIIGGSAMGFLCWNWHPARLFLGDVGSVPLGFLTGWLLLSAAHRGHWMPALILPAYYLADSGLTLLKRLMKGEKIWEAHSQHFYQQAVRGGKSHSEVVMIITMANCALVELALLSTLQHHSPFMYLSLAAGAVAMLLMTLRPRPSAS